jgi:hypothetical protein
MERVLVDLLEYWQSGRRHESLPKPVLLLVIAGYSR